MRTKLLILGIALLAGACERSGDDRLVGEPPPAAAVMMPTGQTVPLDGQLVDLQTELTAALQEEDPERLLQAEAITDRLMQARRSVDWLASGYGVEPRLRQIQALADRVVARLRRGATLEQVRADVETLHQSVADLREQLEREGGGRAPVPLDTLLARAARGETTRRAGPAATGTRAGAPAEPAETPAAEEPAAPATGGALGTPVRDTIPGPY